MCTFVGIDSWLRAEIVLEIFEKPFTSNSHSHICICRILIFKFFLISKKCEAPDFCDLVTVEPNFVAMPRGTSNITSKCSNVPRSSG